MMRSNLGLAACIFGGCSLVAGAATAQVGEAYREGGRAGWDTLGQTYNGMGGVVTSPFRDFNVMRAKIPPPLQQASSRPYNTKGLDSCQAVLSEVAELDLVLGPDVDTPDIEVRHSMYVRGADMAASTAIDAVRSAANHFIPMRGTIRKITGADRAEKKVKKAVLAGQIRRGFLKSYGMQHNCAWPAAPEGFHPAPGGPVWGEAVAPVALPPPAPMQAAVIPAAASVTIAPVQVASQAAAPSPRPVAPTPTLAAVTEPQAGAWRIGAAPMALASSTALKR